ncbi:hypothetical protein WA158_003206 [Blastocystis sp. Blastoise]
MDHYKESGVHPVAVSVPENVSVSTVDSIPVSITETIPNSESVPTNETKSRLDKTVCNSSWTMKHILLFILLACTMLLLGITTSANGVALALVKDYFGNNYDMQGFLVAVGGLGYVFFSFCCSYMLRTVGIRWVFYTGFIIFLVCYPLLIITTNFYVFCVIYFVVSFGTSMFDVGGNCTGTLLAHEHSGIIMHLVHFFYGLGSTLGPLYAQMWTGVLNDSYKGIYLGITVLTGILFLYALFAPFDISCIQEADKSDMSILDALKNKIVWIMAITLGIFYINELGINTWGLLYLKDVYQIDPLGEGATWIAVYFLLYTCSRLFSGFIVDKLGHFNSLTICSVTIFVLYLVGFLIGRPGIWVICCTGYFLAIIFPTVMCVGIDIFGSDVSNAVSVVQTVAGLVNVVLQQLLGNVNEHIGNIWAFRLFIPISLLVAILIQVLYCITKPYLQKQKDDEKPLIDQEKQ